MALPDYPFTTDGCSGGMTAAWKLFVNRTPPWNDCCVKHDFRYWRGGTKRIRKWSDTQLMIDVSNKGYPIIAILMYLAVRVGGHPLLPLPWRWGYGFKWPRSYHA